jgi:hypothetical protein
MEYTTLILFALGLLGILIHNLMKIDGINRSTQGNFKFIPFMRLEWASIMISICVVIVALIAKGEIKKLQAASGYLGLAFVAIGYMAQSIVYHVIGKAEKKLQDANI